MKYIWTTYMYTIYKMIYLDSQLNKLLDIYSGSP